MIRVLLVDDHPALRAGLHTVLRAEPGFVPVGAAASGEELWAALERGRPDVVLLDYHLPGDDGLVLCHRIKRAEAVPGVVIYSAYADTALAVPAVVAGADGVVNKGAPAEELFDVIRTAARGDSVLPPLSGELLAAASARLDEADLPILGMLIDRTPGPEIAAVLGLEGSVLARRMERMLQRLRLAPPSTA